MHGKYPAVVVLRGLLYSFCSASEVIRKEVSNRENDNEPPNSVSGLLGSTLPLSSSLPSVTLVLIVSYKKIV